MGSRRNEHRLGVSLSVVTYQSSVHLELENKSIRCKSIKFIVDLNMHGVLITENLRRNGAYNSSSLSIYFIVVAREKCGSCHQSRSVLFGNNWLSHMRSWGPSIILKHVALLELAPCLVVHEFIEVHSDSH